MYGLLLYLFIVASSIAVPFAFSRLARTIRATRHREREWIHAYLCELGFTPIDGGYRGEIDGILVEHSIHEEYDPSSLDKRYLFCWSIAVPTGGLRHMGWMEATRSSSSLDPRLAEGSLADVSWLSASVRAWLLDPSSQCRIDGGRVWLMNDRFDLTDLQKALAFQHEIAALPRDSATRITALATSDPSAHVRRTILERALEEQSTLGIAIAQTLRADPDPYVRATAVIAVGAPIELLKILCAVELPLDVRWRAALRLLQTGNVEERRYAAEMLAVEVSDDLYDSALQWLVSMGSASESVFVMMLPHVEGGRLQTLAAALGAVGTIAAVSPLRQRQEMLSLLQFRLSSAIDHAVAMIQERAGGARGGLSIASVAERGALSEATHQGTLAQPERQAHPARASQTIERN